MGLAKPGIPQQSHRFFLLLLFVLFGQSIFLSCCLSPRTSPGKSPLTPLDLSAPPLTIPFLSLQAWIFIYLILFFFFGSALFRTHERHSEPSSSLPAPRRIYLHCIKLEEMKGDVFGGKATTSFVLVTNSPPGRVSVNVSLRQGGGKKNPLLGISRVMGSDAWQ